MIRRPPRSTRKESSAASDVYKRQVWYFGEVARSFDDQGSLVGVEAMWRAGRGGAHPGTAMPALPTPGMMFRMEFALGTAEDFARVVSLGNTVTTPAGTFIGCLELEVSSPLDPDEVERKFFAPNVGLVKEVDLDTGSVFELVSIDEN